MEIIIIVSGILCFTLIGVVVYTIEKGSRDKIETIRELTKALLAKDVHEYAEVIPEDNEMEEREEVDEMEEVDLVDEKILIKHLNEEYGDNKS